MYIPHLYRFSIDNSTGHVWVSHSNGLDYEKIKAYSLTVEATDGGGRRAMATLNVHLTDVNDNKPAFEKPEYFAFVTENETTFDSPVTIKVRKREASQLYLIFDRETEIIIVK